MPLLLGLERPVRRKLMLSKALEGFSNGTSYAIAGRATLAAVHHLY